MRLVTIKINFLIEHWEQDGAFYAKCPFLNVVTHGDSKAQAGRYLREEIEFLFQAAEEEGSLAKLMEVRTSYSHQIQSPEDRTHLEFTRSDFELPAGIPVEILKRLADGTKLSA